MKIAAWCYKEAGLQCIIIEPGLQCTSGYGQPQLFRADFSLAPYFRESTVRFPGRSGAGCLIGLAWSFGPDLSL